MRTIRMRPRMTGTFRKPLANELQTQAKQRPPCPCCGYPKPAKPLPAQEARMQREARAWGLTLTGGPLDAPDVVPRGSTTSRAIGAGLLLIEYDIPRD